MLDFSQTPNSDPNSDLRPPKEKATDILASREEELRLAHSWREDGNLKARDRLVSSHLCLVIGIAKRCKGYSIPLGELISEGNIGLIKAVDRFDPGRGVRLSTYAAWWIRAEIMRYILDNWSSVRLATAADQRKIFLNLPRLKSRMQALESGDLSPEQVSEIALYLKVPEEKVIDVNRRMSRDYSLNAPLAGKEEGEWQDRLEDEGPDPEEIFRGSEELEQRREMLVKAMRGLGEREQHIITRRHLHDEPLTLRELSKIHSISCERVRQIEAKAFQKLQKAVRNLMIECLIDQRQINLGEGRAS